ncbi:MAG: exonuclease domain-containing protein [Desulfohalobiaceae bacterium]
MSSWNLKKKYWVFVVIFALIYTMFLGGLAVYLWSEMEPGVQEQIRGLLADNFGALFLVGLCFFMGQLFMLNEIFHNYIMPLYNLEEETTLIVRANPRHRISIKGCREIQDIASSVNSLADHLQSIRDQAYQELRQQLQGLEREKDLYLGILNDLPVGIISCSEEGEILAYNKKASSMFTPASKDQSCFSSCSLLGLRKGINELLNAELLDFALQKLKEQITFSGTHNLLSFTCSSQEDRLLYMQMVPLWREQLFLGYNLLCFDLAEQTELCPAEEKLHLIWPKQSVGLQQILHMVSQEVGLELYPEASSQQEQQIMADVFLLQRLLSFLLHRCWELLGQVSLAYRTHSQEHSLALDILLPQEEVDQELMEFWRTSPLVGFGGQGRELKVQDVLDLHHCELENQDNETDQGGVLRLRFSLPRQEWSEPEWDIQPSNGLQFARLQMMEGERKSKEPLDCDLQELAYTVFDTETTGMNPHAGDEIISISAVRVVNGKLQVQEIFDQLVNPQRLIPAESIKIHGIKQEMVEGQPVISEVLPVFKRFAQGTVLVAHNAYFDMHFLRRKEKQAQVQLDNPVLDTALLSWLIMPHQKDQGLDAVAKRLGVRIYSRHTSLGDALTAAEILLALLPLLNYKGIRTVRQACNETKKAFPDSGL